MVWDVQPQVMVIDIVRATPSTSGFQAVTPLRNAISASKRGD